MADPIFSPDGKWMWTGSEWIPVPPSESTATVNVQDGVIAGDVIINDSSSSCVSCGSKGVTQIACSYCRKMSHCNICEPEIVEERSEKRLCLECYDNLKNERKRIAEEDERKRIAEEDERKRIADELEKEKRIEEKRLEDEYQRKSDVYLPSLNSLIQMQNQDKSVEYCLSLSVENSSIFTGDILCVNAVDGDESNEISVITDPYGSENYSKVRFDSKWSHLGFRDLSEFLCRDYFIPKEGDLVTSIKETIRVVAHDIYRIVEEIYCLNHEDIRTRVINLGWHGRGITDV